MVIPLIKRVNTVGIKYVKGERSIDHYENIIENILGIPIDEIVGLGECGKKKFLVKIKSERLYQQICLKLVGETKTVDENHKIVIEDLSPYKDRVRVVNVPFELPNEALRRLLSNYGKVENIITGEIKEGRLKGVMNLERIVWMIVTKPIPSSLFIKELDNYLYFNYNKQILTCHNCGDPRHKAQFCRKWEYTRPEERENATRIDLTDLIPLNQTETEEHPTGEKETTETSNNISDIRGEDDLVEEQDIADVHIDPSQKENKFRCAKCVYTCSYESIFKDHMKTHAEQHSFNCQECGGKYMSSK